MKMLNGETVFKMLVQLAKSLHDKIKRLDGDENLCRDLYLGIDEIRTCIMDLFEVPEESLDENDPDAPHTILNEFLWEEITLEQCFEQFQSYLAQLGDPAVNDR